MHETRVRHRWLHGVVAVLLVVMTPAFARKKFGRPEPGSLVLHETTYDEVLERYGRPRSKGTSLENGIKLDTLTYYNYSTFKRSKEGRGAPIRVLVASFHERKLVRYLFTSTYKGEHTDFDPTLVERIEKGKTTEREVVAILGEPHGVNEVPSLEEDEEDVRRLTYFYYHPQSELQKFLVVVIGYDDIVTSYSYSESRED